MIMTQAERENIDTFCEKLALALRRINGNMKDTHLLKLATPVEDNQQPDSACSSPEDYPNENNQ